MADSGVFLVLAFVIFGGWGVEVVVWLLRSMPTPGPGDTDAGTYPTRF
ncbi:hypothetical protein [Companilactobacillus furfuricola]|nr:hypothetical protein [Companilactobacillus furfuricola]